MAEDYCECVAPLVLETFMQHRNGINLVKHQVNSFDEFIRHRIGNILGACNSIEVTHDYQPGVGQYQYRIAVSLSNLTLSRPTIVERDGSRTLLTPQECRLRGINYSAGMHVDLHVVAKTLMAAPSAESPPEYAVDEKRILGVPIGKIPIMVGSRYCVTRSMPLLAQGDCRYDLGGYFVLGGTEKVVVSNDRMAENHTFVFHNSKTSNMTYSHSAEIRSVSTCGDGLGTVKSLVLRISQRPNQQGRYIRVALPHAKQDVPVVVLFRALGVESDRQMVAMVTRGCSDEEQVVMHTHLAGSLAEAADVATTHDALEYLGRIMNSTSSASMVARGATGHHRDAAYVNNIIARDILPHSGRDTHSKATYLAYMVQRLLRCVSGLDQPDDRDSYVNKRVDTPGMMLTSLFRVHYIRMLKEMRNSISREITAGAWRPSGGIINVITKVNVTKHIKASIIESGMKFALSTGNWNVKGGGASATPAKVMNNSARKQGLAQVLNRLTAVATLSHLRRINTPAEKNGKMVAPRKLHNSQWGVICPSETPEGASVGLVKNMAMTATITGFSDPNSVATHLPRLGMQPAGDAPTLVLLNGCIVGSHTDAPTLVEGIRALRRQCILNVFTSVCLDTKNRIVSINTEAGRLVRPLWVVSDGRICGGEAPRELGEKLRGMPWWELVWRGYVEYLDVAEAATSMIALTYDDLGKGCRGVLHALRYTHMEIDPSCILGVLASSIPFSDHNQAPRNTYQAAMGKQAIGVNVSNFLSRFDTVNHIMHYPQRALVQTRAARLLRADKLPNGINAMTAIMTYTGYNQEDSVLLSRAAIQRGLFVSTMYKTFREQNNRNHANGEEEFFCKPDPTNTRNMKPCNYGLMHSNGFVPENTRVKEGDIIIGKCMPQKVGAALVHRDSSVPFKGADAAHVDRNCFSDNYFTTTNGDGYTFAKTRTRCIMDPVIGDKFSSRHAQKGTCGMIVDECDMPFGADGAVPDIIINTHAIPSRMTIAQLLEGLLAKAGCVAGKLGNASPFQRGSPSSVAGAVLAAAGMDPTGNETLHDPCSGRRMDVPTFLCPTYYQRLKHLSGQKIHSRASSGPVVLLTRQPTEGRSREGALRQGNMESHVIVTHGMSQFLKERMMECSDNFKQFHCRRCGGMAIANPDRGMYACRACGAESASFSEVRIPYAAKLLLQEMATLNVGTRLRSE